MIMMLQPGPGDSQHQHQSSVYWLLWLPVQSLYNIEHNTHTVQKTPRRQGWVIILIISNFKMNVKMNGLVFSDRSEGSNMVILLTFF